MTALKSAQIAALALFAAASLTACDRREEGATTPETGTSTSSTTTGTDTTSPPAGGGLGTSSGTSTSGTTSGTAMPGADAASAPAEPTK